MPKTKPGLVVEFANASPSLAGTNADGMTVTLSEFAVTTGLDEKNLSRAHLEVDIDGSPAQKTVGPDDSTNKTQLQVNKSMTFTNVRPSSILHVRIPYKSRIGSIRDRVLGEYEGLVMGLLPEDSTGKTVKLVPVDSKADPIEFFFRIVIDDSPSTSLDDLVLDAATYSLANSRLTLARREAGKLASTVSDTVDTAVSIGTQVQSVAEGAKKLDSEQVIGVLVATLDAVVKVGDELSTAHPMIKVAWTVVTCLYKAAKAQQELNADARQLAEEISVMLAYVASCKDLAPVDGRESIVLRAVVLTQEGACLIDTCMAHRFAVRAIVAPFTNMKTRFEDCRRKVRELRQEFDTALIVDTRKEVQDSRKESASARQEAVLLQLPFARDATWNQSRACMPGTRTSLLQNFSSWLDTEDDKASIFWLTAPPGAGKTAFAHTVAFDASSSREIGLLSFFFERAVSDRNNLRAFVGTLMHLLSGLNPQFKASICSTLDEKRELPSARPICQFNELLVHHASTFANQHILLIIDALDECSEYYDDLMTILRDHIPALPPSFRVFVTSRPEKTLLRRLRPLQHVRHLTIELDDAENLSDISTYVRQRFATIAIDHELDGSWPGEERCHLFIEKASGLFAWASVALDYIGRVKLFGRDAKLQEVLSQSSTRVTPVQERMDELYITVLGTCDWNDEEFVQGYQLVVGTIVASRQPLSKSSLEHLLGDTAGVVAEVLDILSPLFTEWKTDDTPIQLLHLTLYDFLTHRERSKGYFIDETEHSRRIGLRCLVILTKTLKDGVSGLGYSSFWDEYIFRPLPVVDVPDSITYACRFWIEHICLVQSSMEKQYIDALEAFSPYVISWVELVSLRNVFPALTKLQEWVMVHPLLQTTSIAQNLASPNLAWSLHNLSNRLADVGRREDVLRAIEDAVRIHRQLAQDRPEAFNPDLALSLNNLSVRLGDVGRREDALSAIEDAVHIHRQLAQDSPEAFKPVLASSLNNLSNQLGDVGRREDALSAIEEAVRIHRQLAQDRPEALNPDLARSLNNLSNRLGDVGRREDALSAIEEAVRIRRQLAQDRPEAFLSALAESLNNLSIRLGDVGRREDALRAIEDAVRIRRQLAQDHPEAFLPALADSLNNLSCQLGDVGRREDALSAIEEAVRIDRQLAQDRPEAFLSALASSLNNLSNRLGDVGRREDALSAIEEAVRIRRQLAQDRPMAFKPVLASSLNNLSNALGYVGRREDALSAIEEAVRIRRQLAQDHPMAFKPVLASSLRNLSIRLADVGRREDALSAIEEAVHIDRQLAQDRPEAFKPVLASSLNNLSNALGYVGRREDALSAIEEAVRIRRQLAQDRPEAFNPALASSLNNLSNRLGDVGRREDALSAIEEAVHIYRKFMQDHPDAFNPNLVFFLCYLSCRYRDSHRAEDALQSARECLALYHASPHIRPTVLLSEEMHALEQVADCMGQLGHDEEMTKFQSLAEALKRKWGAQSAAGEPELASDE